MLSAFGKILTTVLVIGLGHSSALGQNICGCCDDSLKQKRIDILGGNLKVQPYTAVARLFVNSRRFAGTASFIADNVLITAKHNLFKYTKPRVLYLRLNTTNGDTLIKINKKQYKIFSFGTTKDFDVKDDISLVMLKKGLLEGLNYSKFDIPDLLNLSDLVTSEIHATGYPCDKRPQERSADFPLDTLTDKYVNSQANLVFSEDKSFVGMYLCACKGDSGSPVWIYSEEGYKLVAIMRGLSNTLNDELIPVATILTESKIRKIREIINSNNP